MKSFGLSHVMIVVLKSMPGDNYIIFDPRIYCIRAFSNQPSAISPQQSAGIHKGTESKYVLADS